MKVGDLVEKNKGYNPKDKKLTGIIIDIVVDPEEDGFCKKVKVWSCDGEIESWLYSFCEVISESR